MPLTDKETTEEDLAYSDEREEAPETERACALSESNEDSPVTDSELSVVVSATSALSVVEPNTERVPSVVSVAFTELNIEKLETERLSTLTAPDTDREFKLVALLTERVESETDPLGTESDPGR